MLLLCVCWWKWCDVDPTTLLLELVELLSGLGVAIVVLGFRQQRSGCNAEWNFALSASRRDTAPLERSSCTRATSVPLLPSNPVGNIVNHGFTAQCLTYFSITYANQHTLHISFISPYTHVRYSIVSTRYVIQQNSEHKSSYAPLICIVSVHLSLEFTFFLCETQFSINVLYFIYISVAFEGWASRGLCQWMEFAQLS